MNGKPDNKNGKVPPSKKIISFLPYILIPILIIAGISFYADKQKNENLEYYEVVALFDEGKVKSYQLNLSNGALVYFLEGEDPKNHRATDIRCPV